MSARTLSADGIATIRRLAREGRTGRQIAAETGIGRHSISHYWPEDVVRPNASRIPRPRPPRPKPVEPPPVAASPNVRATQRLSAALEGAYTDVPDSDLEAEERCRRFWRKPRRADTVVASSNGWVWP